MYDEENGRRSARPYSRDSRRSRERSTRRSRPLTKLFVNNLDFGVTDDDMKVYNFKDVFIKSVKFTSDIPYHFWGRKFISSKSLFSYTRVCLTGQFCQKSV